MDQTSLFLISILIPFVFCRLLLVMIPTLFKAPLIKRMTGLQIHHYHYGILLVIAGVIQILRGAESLSIMLIGLGLGLLLDEATTVMLIPSNPAVEFEVYDRSFTSTVVVFAGVCLLILILRFFDVLTKIGGINQ